MNDHIPTQKILANKLITNTDNPYMNRPARK